MKNEIIQFQHKFQEAGTLLDNALDILTQRDVLPEKDIDQAMLQLFHLRDTYFLGFSNWDQQTQKESHE